MRVGALLALALVGRGAKEAVGPLIVLLKNDDVEVRFGAAAALGSIATDGPEAVGPLAGPLHDKEAIGWYYVQTTDPCPAPPPLAKEG